MIDHKKIDNRYCYTYEPLCPYCGYEQQNSHEIDFDGLEDVQDVVCEKCRVTFSCVRHTEWRYSTEPIST